MDTIPNASFIAFDPSLCAHIDCSPGNFYVGKFLSSDYNIQLLNDILKKVFPNFPKISLGSFNLQSPSPTVLTDIEKYAVVLICTVLSAGENTTIAIEESQIEGHKVAFNDLLNILKKERRDCKFVKKGEPLLKKSLLKKLEEHENKLLKLSHRVSKLEGGIERNRVNLITTDLYGTHSLTSQGVEVLERSGGEKYINDHLELLRKAIQDKSPKTAYDIQETAKEVIKNNTTDDKFNEIQDFIYENGFSLPLMIEILSIYLKNIVLFEKNNEVNKKVLNDLRANDQY